MAFKLKSGNTTNFKNMGSSPIQAEEVKKGAKTAWKGIKKGASAAWKLVSRAELPLLIAYDVATSDAKYKDYPKGDYRKKYAQAGKPLDFKDKVAKAVYDNTIGFGVSMADAAGELSGLYDLPDSWSEWQSIPQPHINEKTNFRKPRKGSVEGYTGGYPSNFGGYSGY